MAVVAQVVGTKVGNTVNVRRGKKLTKVRVARDLTVADGDNVVMDSVNGTYIVLARTDLTATPVRNPDEDDEPDSKPGLVTGTLVIAPTSTNTYRSGKWGRYSADLEQGGNPANIGVAYYSDQVRQLKGSTIDSATVNITRVPGGPVTAQTATLRLATQKYRPVGPPVLTSSTAGPSLLVGETNPAFPIPTSWITSMANNTAGGIAVAVAISTPYIRFAGMKTYSPAFTLTINWQRTES